MVKYKSINVDELKTQLIRELLMWDILCMCDIYGYYSFQDLCDSAGIENIKRAFYKKRERKIIDNALKKSEYERYKLVFTRRNFKPNNGKWFDHDCGYIFKFNLYELKEVEAS